MHERNFVSLFDRSGGGPQLSRVPRRDLREMKMWLNPSVTTILSVWGVWNLNMASASIYK